MSNYTSKTAALKATTIDTHLLDAKHITTKKILINGSSLEDVILATSPKGINNAVKISTTIGNIHNTTITNGTYNVSLTNGILSVENTDTQSSSWQPTHLVIKGSNVFVQWSKIDNKWNCEIWGENDDLSLLYGGIDDNSTIEILIIIYQ